MCRHLAYLGPSVALHELLYGDEHALADQARSPRLQTSGRDNPDGWGVGWYAAGETMPRRHRSALAMWHDDAFVDRSRGVRAGAVLAAARYASPGSEISATNAAPFGTAQWLFSLNGVVDGFRDGIGDVLRGRVSERRRGQLEGDTDSEVLFGLVLDCLDAGAAPADALGQAVSDVQALTTGRLNLLLTDGTVVAATRAGNSLFFRNGASVTIASEPLDADPAWHEVDEGSVIMGERP